MRTYTSTTDRSLALDDRQWLCDRCGIVLQRRYPPKDGVCLDCRQVLNPTVYKRHFSSSIVDGVEVKCQPWPGEVDEQDRPILYGRLYMPGTRTCGHRDCVARAHIVPEDTDV